MGALTPAKAGIQKALRIRDYSPGTISRYVYCLRSLTAYFNCPLEELTVEDINVYQEHLTRERNYSWSTFNVHVFAIRFFFLKVLGRDWQIDYIPYSKTRSRLPEVLNESEIIRLFEAVSNIKHRVILMTIYSAGLRVSEAVHLKISDIDSKRMTIRVEQGKGRKDRYVPLSATLLPMLREYWKSFRPSDWLFEGRYLNTPLNRRSVARFFTKAKTDAHIRKAVTVHSLRHSFASHLLEKGTNIRSIQLLPGHKSLSSTMVYTHVASNYIAVAGSPLDKLTYKGTEYSPNDRLSDRA